MAIGLVPQISAPTYETVLTARFLMVARDPLNRGSAFVAPLAPEGPQEEAIFKEGVHHKSLRQKSSKESLFKVRVCVGLCACVRVV